MTRIGRANEGDGDCWLGKAERHRRLRRRLARFKIAGEDLPGDHYRATFGGALQVNEQVLPVWTKRRLNYFDALVGSDTGVLVTVVQKVTVAGPLTLLSFSRQPGLSG